MATKTDGLEADCCVVDSCESVTPSRKKNTLVTDSCTPAAAYQRKGIVDTHSWTPSACGYLQEKTKDYQLQASARPASMSRATKSNSKFSAPRSSQKGTEIHSTRYEKQPTFTALLNNLPKSNSIFNENNSYYYNFDRRVASYNDHRWPWQDNEHDLGPTSMASAGFFFIGQCSATGNLVVQCYKCNLELGTFIGGEIPLISHLVHRPKCEIVQNFYKKLHPDSPLWKYGDVRLGSFSWYEEFTHIGRFHVQYWAAAGFFYSMADKSWRELRCHSCETVVSNQQMYTTTDIGALHNLRCHYRRMTTGYTKYQEYIIGNDVFCPINKTMIIGEI